MTRPADAPFLVLRWGRAEYERPPLVGLPAGVEVVDADGDDAPLERCTVLVVPSVRRVTAADVPRLRRCRLVLTTTSGFDHVDVAAVRAAGIDCARLPLARRDAVVETALGMMLALARRFGPIQAGAASGRWEREKLPAYGAHLLGTVGVVGHGVIGRRMAEVLRALGAEVLACDPLLPDGVDLDILLARAGVVTLHCELTESSRGLFDAPRIAAMRPGAILVNTARGKVVDAPAALAAVRAGHLAGFGCDVFPTEPADLSGYLDPRVIVLPHAAGWHPGLDDRIAEGIHTAVCALRDGAPVPFVIGG